METPTTKEVRLTERQQRVLEYIRDRIENRGYGPTVREIGDEFDIRSPNGVACHLKALEKKGLISREANRSRAIQLTRLAKPNKGVKLRGQLINGILQEISGSDQILDIENLLEVKKSGTFVVQIKGNSEFDGFFDGDYIIVKKTGNADKGQVVLIKTNGQVTLKRLQSDLNSKQTVQEQATVAEIPAYDKSSRIVGVILGVVRPI